MNVLFQAHFLMGRYNTPLITDYEFLEPNELKLLIRFVKDIQTKEPVCGTNKKSDDCFNYQQKQIVKKYDIYHYHINIQKNCSELCNMKIYCLDITEEKDNLTCKEVVHYLLNNGDIIIIGYSKIHGNSNFPLFYNNPMLQRLKSNIKVTLNQYQKYLQYCILNSKEPSIGELGSFVEKTYNEK